MQLDSVYCVKKTEEALIGHNNKNLDPKKR